MTLKSDVVTFLRTNSNLHKINFHFLTYYVYPKGYFTDVADMIDKGRITVGVSAVLSGIANYYMDIDELNVKPSFTITNWKHQAYLVHECTHALLDYQHLGSGSAHEHEAVAYLAEALFLEAGGYSSLGGTAIRTESHRIAKLLISGTYTVSPTDASSLVAFVAAEPLYAPKPPYESNGYDRSLKDSLLRAIP